MADAKNQLYYGDNLQVLRDHIADQSVDLIYLDPPFNSRQDYNPSAEAFVTSHGTKSCNERSSGKQERAHR